MNLAREATKPKKISTSDRVAERLITLIREGWVKPGDRLPSEHELMARLGVGRSSVREAIRGLAMAGVLEAKPRRGTVVVSNVVNELSENLNRYATYWADEGPLRTARRPRGPCGRHGRAARDAQPDRGH